MPKIAHIDTLPRKLVGAACVLENEAGEILVMKPNYMEGWLIPGGVCRQYESPQAVALRKTQEEVGVDTHSPALVGTFHSLRRSEEGQRYESVHFIFVGGVLTKEQILKIKLQKEVFEEYRFVPVAKALELLSFPLNDRVRQSLEAREKRTVAYFELVEE
ncbi:MAG: hypothetical protein COV10_03675 [Candidatus Vogelbacteria bacterium CG10_big_fil_rev_8_21_14_0_10_51_16]|uniref:Nudix hydrolase domain-containing protein n=1 Tax=Candidatus Vogelbacteria bacterium CG10_big_fil_rev_8_21_14_0_10_51_16 TaxID=1975045 RepID=A0A2H0RDL9_9BACT|nr:MAG: hypothetical protein COV10_03675 [Candidatus Vogelbacteria bacterium CG10_big_fil_rev_8_21_14_0_10_51_16]